MKKENDFKALSLSILRWVGILEGLSYLLLLGIAMPLKYFMDMPMAVKYAGWAHGLLFMGFLGLVLYVGLLFRKSLLWMLGGFIASLLPFGPFIWDSKSLKPMINKNTASETQE